VAKKDEKKNDSICDQYTNAYTNWLQIEMDKIFQTIQVNHNNFS
jgi:hypothetical protein